MVVNAWYELPASVCVCVVVLMFACGYVVVVVTTVIKRIRFCMLFVTLSYVVFRQRCPCSNVQRPECHTVTEAVSAKCPRRFPFATECCLVSQSRWPKPI